MNDVATPQGELTLRSMAMPADSNPNGDIFGGWLLAQMDLAGSILARRIAQGRVATVALESMSFHKPVYVGDVLSCYVKLEQIGNTSIRVHVDSWVERWQTRQEVQVTEGIFTFVAIDDQGQKRRVPKS